MYLESIYLAIVIFEQPCVSIHTHREPTTSCNQNINRRKRRHQDQFQGSISCSRTLQHADRRHLGSNKKPWFHYTRATTLPPELALPRDAGCKTLESS